MSVRPPTGEIQFTPTRGSYRHGWQSNSDHFGPAPTLQLAVSELCVKGAGHHQCNGTYLQIGMTNERDHFRRIVNGEAVGDIFWGALRTSSSDSHEQNPISVPAPAPQADPEPASTHTASNCPSKVGLHGLPEPEPETSLQWTWGWTTDLGTVEPYSPQICTLLEEALKTGQKQVDVGGDRFVDVDTYQQIVRSDHTRRRKVTRTRVNLYEGYTGPLTKRGTPDKRSKQGKAWYAQQDPYEGYHGPRNKDGTPDKRTTQGSAWFEKIDPFVEYTGPRKRDGTPDKRTKEGMAWHTSASQQLIAARATFEEEERQAVLNFQRAGQEQLQIWKAARKQIAQERASLAEARRIWQVEQERRQQIQQRNREREEEDAAVAARMMAADVDELASGAAINQEAVERRRSELMRKLNAREKTKALLQEQGQPVQVLDADRKSVV